MIEDNGHTLYEYDPLDRLIGSTYRDKSNVETRNKYSYDRRGNQIALTSGDVIKKTFEYDVGANGIDTLISLLGAQKLSELMKIMFGGGTC